MPAARRRRSRPPFARSVFVNCPFDAAYKPLADALLFTVHDCGFIARSALEDAGARETRLHKIARLLGESRWSIHDLSRSKLTPDSPSARFNMPFELGFAFGQVLAPGARTRGRDLFFLYDEPFEDKRILSDLGGQDGGAHGNDPARVIGAVRKFLHAKAKQAGFTGTVRGARGIASRLAAFNAVLPAMAKARHISEAEIASLDYLPDWLGFVTEWQRKMA